MTMHEAAIIFNILFMKISLHRCRAFLADPIENGSSRIKQEMMFRGKMIAQLRDLIAMKMDQSAALFAFAVIAVFTAVSPDRVSAVFKTGRRIGIDDIFIDNPLIHKPFQLSVDGGCRNRASLFTEMIADILRRDMAALHAFQIIRDFFEMLCRVSCLCTHKKASKMKTIFDFRLTLYERQAK